ncbi:hypothetical protein, partial [Gluconobacter thailandicus]|uniref:hypothetical protein n=1 Tax=Gluconobacter thailandicus TaxID=257438 RepID=UPI001A7E6328
QEPPGRLPVPSNPVLLWTLCNNRISYNSPYNFGGDLWRLFSGCFLRFYNTATNLNLWQYYSIKLFYIYKFLIV